MTLGQLDPLSRSPFSQKRLELLSPEDVRQITGPPPGYSLLSAAVCIRSEMKFKFGVVELSAQHRLIRNLHFGIFAGALIIGMGVAACTSSTIQTEEEQIMTYPALPERQSPRPETTGSVPHQQIGVDPVPDVNEELFRRAFTLPGVENRPSAFSLPGARGLWIDDTVTIVRQDQIVSGREFAHIHPDGSLHASLPLDRARDAVDAGWAEPQPIADQLGVPGLVMIYTPQSHDELKSVLQLIVDSYNFVTGSTIDIADLGE